MFVSAFLRFFCQLFFTHSDLMMPLIPFMFVLFWDITSFSIIFSLILDFFLNSFLCSLLRSLVLFVLFCTDLRYFLLFQDIFRFFTLFHTLSHSFTLFHALSSSLTLFNNSFHPIFILSHPFPSFLSIPTLTHPKQVECLFSSHFTSFRFIFKLSIPLWLNSNLSVLFRLISFHLIAFRLYLLLNGSYAPNRVNIWCIRFGCSDNELHRWGFNQLELVTFVD